MWSVQRVGSIFASPAHLVPVLIPLGVGIPAWIVSVMFLLRRRFGESVGSDGHDPNTLPAFPYILPFVGAFTSVLVVPLVFLIAQKITNLLVTT